MNNTKLLLTAGRRARIVEILQPLGEGVAIDRKAELIRRALGEPCTHGEALSLLSQFRQGKPRRRKSWAQIQQERFERHKARRPDLY